MTNKEICFSYLTETAALSRAVAIGIMANIRHESNFNPTAKGDNGTSYGICQWHNTRWERLKNWCNDNGYSQSDLKAQLRFLLWEFRKYYESAWDSICEQPNTVEGAAEVAYIMCVKYEIPANKEESGRKRGDTARSLWEEFSTYEGGNVDNSDQEDIPIKAETGTTYRVKSGDTLSKIAKIHGVKWQDIVIANPQRWNPNLIYPGEILNIPKG